MIRMLIPILRFASKTWLGLDCILALRASRAYVKVVRVYVKTGSMLRSLAALIVAILPGTALAEDYPTQAELKAAEGACESELGTECLLMLAFGEAAKMPPPNDNYFVGEWPLNQILHAVVAADDQALADRVFSRLQGENGRFQALLALGRWAQALELGETLYGNETDTSIFVPHILAAQLAQNDLDAAFALASTERYANALSELVVGLKLVIEGDTERGTRLLERVGDTALVDKSLALFVARLSEANQPDRAAELVSLISDLDLQLQIKTHLADTNGSDPAPQPRAVLRAQYEEAMLLPRLDRIEPLVKLGEAQRQSGQLEDARLSARMAAEAAIPRFFPAAPIRGPIENRAEDLSIPIAQTALLLHRLGLDAQKVFAVAEILISEIEGTERLRINFQFQTIRAEAEQPGAKQTLVEMMEAAVARRPSRREQAELVGIAMIALNAGFLTQTQEIATVFTANNIENHEFLRKAVVEAWLAQNRFDAAILTARDGPFSLMQLVAEALIEADQRERALAYLLEERDRFRQRHALGTSSETTRQVDAFHLAELGGLLLRLGFAEAAGDTLRDAYDGTEALPSGARADALVRIAQAFLPERPPDTSPFALITKLP